MNENDEIIEVANVFRLSFKNGILNVEVKPDVSVDLDTVKEYMMYRREKMKDNPVLTLFDVTGSTFITKEAREYAAGREAKGLNKAVAIVTDSSPTRILANIFIKINQPPQPTKLFDSKKLAIEWLEKYR